MKNRKVRPSAEFIRNIAENGFQDTNSFENQSEESQTVQTWSSGIPELDYLNQTAKEDYWKRDSVYYGQDIIILVI